MEIIFLNETHIEQIAELEKQCFSDPWSAASIRYELTNPLSKWLVAVEGERVVGYVGSQTVLGESDVMNVAVAPDCRRKGIGNLLVEELTELLKKDGVYKLTLEVRVSNDPAIALYEKLGFQVLGRRPNYYSHPKEDAWIMGKEWQL